MIKNEPKIKGGIIDLNRAQIEQRAAAIALTYQKALEEGADAEKIGLAASTAMGKYLGDQELHKMEDPSDVSEFTSRYFNGIALKTFEIEKTHDTREEVKLEFNYCPLVAMWQKLNFSEDEIAKLCDIAMESDRSLAKTMGFSLEITDTIAKGSKKCHMKFFKP